MRWGKLVLAAALSLSLVAAPSSPVAADSSQPVMTLVMQTVRWGGSKDFSETYFSGLYSMLRDQVAPFWSAMLNNSVKFETVDLTTSPVTMLGKLSCTPTKEEESRIAAADTTKHTGTVVRFVLGDFSHCSWGGYVALGDIKTPSTQYLAAQTNVYAVQLERQLGAALGLGDSSEAPCIPSGFSDKNFASCARNTYAVSYDLMGDVWDGIWKEVFSGARARTDLLNIHNRWWLGLLAPGELHEVWTASEEISLAISNQPAPVHGLYFAADGAEYLAEFRRTYYGAKGVAVFRLGVPAVLGTRRFASAMKPTDAVPSAVGGGTLMQKGDIFINANRTLTVEVLSLDDKSARVRILRTDKPSTEAIPDAQSAAKALKSGNPAVFVGSGDLPITQLSFIHPNGAVEFARDKISYSIPHTTLPPRPEWSDLGTTAYFTRTSGAVDDLASTARLKVTYADGTTTTSNFVSLDEAARATPTPSPTPSATPSKAPAPSKVAITCVKGKQTKRLVGASPRCPTGWKRK